MPTFKVNHSPHLQLGDAPLDGFQGSETDQVELLWQTIPGTGNGDDSFVVEYRLANSSGPWTKASGSEQLNTIGTQGRVNHSVEIDGLAYNTNYEYRVQHLRGTSVVETFQNTFETRLAAGDQTSFSFAAYGDSAYRSNISGFRQVQGQINQKNLDFSLLLGDNIYDSGSQTEADLRFDASINPEAAAWSASKIDYVAFGNHDVRTQGGDPTEDNYSVPIPIVGLDSSVAPPASETPEHNYSFDYGDVHFITFDTNALNDASRLDGILDWVEADANASDSKWTVVFGHHPISGGPEKGESPSDNYYNQVVSRFNNVGVDLFLTGHSHTVSWTYPLLGQQNGKATFVKDTDKNYDKGAGLVQGIFGTGGKDLRKGDFGKFPFIASGFSASTNPKSEFGFAQIDVTQNQLKVSYIAADDGSVIDSFTITDGPKGGDVLTVTAATQLKATFTGSAGSEVSEIIMIAADNDRGAINGKLPGEAGYLKAALTKATVVFSTLQAGEFDTLTPQRILDVTSGQFVQFAVIKGGSLGDLQRGGPGEIIFANAKINGDAKAAVQLDALDAQTVDLDFRLPDGSRFQDLMLKLNQGNIAHPLGSNLQGATAEHEMVDLRGQSGPTVNATIEVFREAKFNNTVGFYTVEDEQGSVIDPLTGAIVQVGEAGYLEAALANRVEVSLTGQNGQISSYNVELNTGKLLSTFLVVDGAIEELLDTGTANDPAIYFNHIGANTDGVDHMRLLGDNVFGYEDKAGGGDMDFDDVIVKLKFAN